MTLDIKGVLFLLAVICFFVVAVIGFDWLAPDKPADAEQWYRGMLGFAGVFLAAGLLVRR